MFIEIKKRLLLIYLIVIRATSTIRHVGIENLPTTSGFVLATWHCNLTSGIFIFNQLKLSVLVSPSPWGSVADYLVRKMGGVTARGSKGFLSSKWLPEIRAHFSQGINGLVTVDGPSGPSFECKPGVILLAIDLKVPVVSCNVHVNRKIILKKIWDKHQFPLPFCTITFHWGKPMMVEDWMRGADIRELQKKLGEQISQLIPEDHPGSAYAVLPDQ